MADPAVVGLCFVKSYYKSLNTAPQDLHLYFSKGATYTYGWEGAERDDGTACTTAKGREEIKETLKTLQIGLVKVLSVISSQESVGRGIVVMVTGEWTPDQSQNVSRRFMETFFLEPQGTNGFCIRNDIFYILQESLPKSSQVREIQKSTKETPEAAPVSKKDNIVDERASSAPVPAPETQEPKAAAPKRVEVPATHQKEEPKAPAPVKEAVEAPPAAAAVAAAPAQEPETRPPPSSWANLLRRGQNAGAPTNGHVEEKPAPQTATKQTQKQGSAPKQNAAPSSEAQAGVQKIFVGQIPQNVSEAAIVAAFEQFAHGATVTLAHVNLAKRCAFVESTHPKFLESALAGPVLIDGKEVLVQKAEPPKRHGGQRGGRGGSSARGNRGGNRGNNRGRSYAPKQ